MIKQIKNYFYERFTDFTISPPNFLPMIVTTRDKATQPKDLLRICVLFPMKVLLTRKM